jgi:hypothetical protein
MEIEDEITPDQSSQIEEQPTYEKSPPVEDFPSTSELPSLEELAPPDFDIESSASEYDTEYVLEEESSTLGSVLKDLGWDQEED